MVVASSKLDGLGTGPAQTPELDQHNGARTARAGSGEVPLTLEELIRRRKAVLAGGGTPGSNIQAPMAARPRLLSRETCQALDALVRAIADKEASLITRPPGMSLMWCVTVIRPDSQGEYFLFPIYFHDGAAIVVFGKPARYDAAGRSETHGYDLTSLLPIASQSAGELGLQADQLLIIHIMERLPNQDPEPTSVMWAPRWVLEYQPSEGGERQHCCLVKEYPRKWWQHLDQDPPTWVSSYHLYDEKTQPDAS